MSVLLGGEYEITIRQGESFSETFSQREEDEVTVIPFPAGTTAKSEMRSSGILKIEFVCFVDEEAGDITISASADDTAGLDSGGRFDIFTIPPNGENEMFIRGKVKFVPRVTVVNP